ncbi:MAG: hypothetical protein Q9M92_12265 [Enterobacterales bacterium]|nr:hypothetical protein [Enterobacterales bacterium]
MSHAVCFNTSHDAYRWVERILKSVPGMQNKRASHDYQIEIQIPNYPHFISKHYQALLQQDPKMLCQQANIPNAFGFYYFGIRICLNQSANLYLHDQNMDLIAEIKQLIDRFGVVSFINCELDQEIRDLNHFNNFAHLNFHRDRHDIHDNHYSMYTRSPRVKEQQAPRTASTLFIDNAIAYLQGRVEGLFDGHEQGRRGKYEIFHNQNLQNLFGTLFLEQAWNAPTGNGEICIIDNKTLLHSSYKQGSDPGYRIGARYLY